MLKQLIKRLPLSFWVIVFSSLCLFFRLHSGLDVTNYLWAEDGEVFFNQAAQFGVSSIFREFAGYLHLYPRLIAWGGSFISINYIPYLYLCGWFVAFSVSIRVVAEIATNEGIDSFSLFTLIAFIVLQPNDSEVFFSLTNSQWFTGLALMLAVSVKNEFKLTVSAFLITFVAVFTGPFSILAAAILTVKLFLYRHLNKQNAWFFILLFLGVVVQAGYLLSSSRLRVSSSMNYDFLAWAKSFGVIFLFGANHLIGALTAAILLLSVVYFVYKNMNYQGQQHIDNKLILIIFVAIGINIVAVFYAFKNPYAIMEMAKAGGGRYTLIPYTFIIFIAIYISKSNPNFKKFIVLAVGIISVIQFKQANRDDLYFNSYTNASQYLDTDIPINPVYGRAPSCHLKPYIISNSLYGTKHHSVNLVPSSLSKLTSVVRQPVNCGNSKDIAIELNSTNSISSWVSVYLSDNEKFDNAHSIRRFYRGENSAMYFAFPNGPVDQYVGISDSTGKIQKINLYCIP